MKNKFETRNSKYETNSAIDIPSDIKGTAGPHCPVFGRCGGCQLQDVAYGRQLKLKESALRALLEKTFPAAGRVLAPIVPSPQSYHYRSRMDMKILRTRSGDVFLGFSPEAGKGRVVPTDSCAIAIREMSAFVPELKKQAAAKLPARYRIASLVVKTGDDGRVRWGGIGRGSLKMAEDEYLWTEVAGRRIFYSLDTFFQANLSILPALIECIAQADVLDRQTRFFDLYGGVGLFGLCLHDKVKDVVLIEENVHAVKLAEYNVRYHGLTGFTLVAGRMEDHLEHLLAETAGQNVGLVDPPRQGLSAPVASFLAGLKGWSSLFYLSCNPQALVRDLEFFTRVGWVIRRVVPFDFFPQTRHLEVLAVLRR